MPEKTPYLTFKKIMQTECRVKFSLAMQGAAYLLQK